MPTTVKKIALSVALLCALVPAACIAPAGSALAAEAVATGAAAAPSGAGDSNAPASPQGQTTTGSLEGVSLATWFGPGLFGNRTACGQVLTRRLVGLANRTLPCGTLVKVSYRGRRLTIPVVDRGPYGPLHASWDLTQAAARLLDMAETSRIDATIVGHVQNSPELGLPGGHGAASASRPTPVAGATGGAAAS